MKKMDALGLKICSYQAALFEMSSEETDCSSNIFIRRFMNSDLAKKMDRPDFFFNAPRLTDAFREIEFQYGESAYGTNRFTPEELYWIGYIYRYWCYVSEKTSKQVYRIIKPDKLRKLYLPYHSLDPLQAIERIIETIDAGGYAGMDDVARGVMALRKVRNRSKYQIAL